MICCFGSSGRLAAGVLLTALASVSLSAFAAKPQAAETPAAGAPSAAVSYYHDVRPILQAHCQGCHQPAKPSGGREMTTHADLLAAGDSELAAVVPGKPDESYLVELITPADGEAAMPQEKKPLADPEIALIRRWIEEGAKDDTPAGAVVRIDAEHPPVYRGPPVITSLDWSPNGELLAVAGFHEVLLHKADGSGLAARLVGMSERIESVRFSPDGTKLAVTGGRPAQTGELQVWDVEKRELLLSIPVTHDSVYGASWSPDGKRIAFGCTDSSVRVVDAETGEQVLYQSAHDDWVLDTVFSVDGSHLATVGRDMAAKLIEVPTQRFVDNITSITPGALKGGIQSVERHPLRDEILFGGADGTPKIYRMHRTTARVIGDDANQLWELPALPGRVFSVDITPDGRVIAAGSSLDGHGHVYTYRMEPEPVIPAPIQAILHKPTHTRSAEEKAQLKQHFDAGVKMLAKVDIVEGGVYAVALSPDGKRVAAAGGDGMVRLLDSESGSLVASFVPVEISAVDEQVAAIAKPQAADDQKTSSEAAADEPPLPENDAVVRIGVEPTAIAIDGPARYAQVIVTAELASGAKVDITRRAQFSFSAPVATAGAHGLIAPSAAGHALLTISFGEQSATVDVQVSGFSEATRADFIRDVAPILARAGCNQGTCHGSQAGKNGFKLSLRGYDAIFDVRALADDLASRRVNVASPAESLMLLKPTAAVPHEGGQVIQPGSKYYETLRQWIAEGARLDVTAARVQKVEVMPKNRVVEAIGARQQVRVVATYADGSQRDVTREAFLESGNTDVVQTVPDRPGLVEALRRGEAAVLVRYEGQYAATTLTVMGDRTGFEWEVPAVNNRIDELVAAKLQRTKTLSSPVAGEYEFVRRVYLDLTGLPPTPEQVEEFVGEPRESQIKRDALIEKLIGSDDYVEYWTNKWADLLMVNRKFLGLEGAAALRKWIRGELSANTPYDQFVRKILTATGSNKDNPAAGYFKALRTPDALMENTTHLFLATRFNCNKCHDHPFERWTQDQYYQLSAYFAQVGLSKDPAGGDAMIGQTAVEEGKPLYEIVADLPEGEVTHIRTGTVAAPAFPFDCDYEVKKDASRREQLAAWITSPDNPYFARSYVNRIWGYLTGRGIIEPLDDIRAGNPPTNPELLDYLTKEFIESGFNTRHVFNLICKSRTYQLSVATNEWNEDDQINFSHARARRLPAEVLYDAIYRATGATSAFPGVPAGARAATLPDVGVELPDGFLGNLGRPARESACECERSSNLQLGPVMALVSGPTVGNAISDPENAITKLVAEVKNDSELVQKLFLRFLSRPGREAEVAAARDMLEQLEADHSKLVAELEAASEELTPAIARQELERQEKIVRLQTEIEVERELLKLRRPREEQARQERIAKAKAALAEYEAQLAAKLPEWEAGQKGATPWHPVDPIELGATFESRFHRQTDRSVFADQGSGTGAYRFVAPIELDRVTGIRLEALADDRLPDRGPGRNGNGNFVLTELGAHVLPAVTRGPQRLVQSWDFANDAEGWQTEGEATLAADSGRLHVLALASRAGIKTTFSAPAGTYELEIDTAIRPGVRLMVQWATSKQPDFDDARAERRTLVASNRALKLSPFVIKTDAELTALRILVEDEQSSVTLDAIRLCAVDRPSHADVKLQNAQATFTQVSFDVRQAIDGDAASRNNGWAIAGQLGVDQTAIFELSEPLEKGKEQLLQLLMHQAHPDGDHTLGRFRVSVTDAVPPHNFGLPPELIAILAKPADQRSDAERNKLLTHVRNRDEQYAKLQAAVAVAEQPLPEDPKLKALRQQLAAARKALPVDPKLQKLRRAVALSEEQRKNRRLTVAQDIAWALINNPAFLYNH